MTHKLRIILLTIVAISTISCSSQSTSTTYKLTESEINICNKLQIDTTIVQDIRNYNSSKIEPFHYSLSKIIQKDTVIEADPIYLKGLVFQEQNSKSYDLIFSLK